MSADPQGLTFDSGVRDYEAGRTAWPSEVTDDIEATTVLDLGAGTGKLTRVLVTRFPEVIAVEPLPGMRALGEQLVPAAEWLQGTAEDVPVPDASMDAAFVADAFHWFDSRAAVSELGRVLRPGGNLTVLFATWDGSFQPGMPAEALAAVQDVARRTGTSGGPKAMSGAWREGFEDASFAPFEERELRFEHITDRSGIISYYLSMSTIVSRPRSERDALAQRLRALTGEGEQRLRLRARLYRTTRL